MLSAIRGCGSPQPGLGANVRIGTMTPLSLSTLVCRLMCEEVHMATNLAIDPDLLDRALSVSGERTKKAAVTRALEEFIARREQVRILELFGQVEFDPSYDHKSERSRG